MKYLKYASLIIGLTLPVAGAFAHSDVNSTMPENGAVLDGAPENIHFNFTDKTRLTKVSLAHNGGKASKLDLSAYKEFGNEFLIPISNMASGTYQVEWRGLGSDGHPIKCKFSFTVK